MAAEGTPTEKVNKAVPQTHDRVSVLSVRADGTHDQLNPELLDPEGVVEYTKVQFREQAIGIADDNRIAGGVGGAVTIIGKPGDEPDEVVPATTDAVRQDPSIKARAQEHEKVAQAAEKAAEAVIKSLDRPTSR